MRRHHVRCLEQYLRHHFYDCDILTSTSRQYPRVGFSSFIDRTKLSWKDGQPTTAPKPSSISGLLGCTTCNVSQVCCVFPCSPRSTVILTIYVLLFVVYIRNLFPNSKIIRRLSSYDTVCFAIAPQHDLNLSHVSTHIREFVSCRIKTTPFQHNSGRFLGLWQGSW